MKRKDSETESVCHKRLIQPPQFPPRTETHSLKAAKVTDVLLGKQSTS